MSNVFTKQSPTGYTWYSRDGKTWYKSPEAIPAPKPGRDSQKPTHKLSSPPATDGPKHPCGHEYDLFDYICQACATVKCSCAHKSQWRPDITGSARAANVCPSCIQAHDRKPIVPKNEEPMSLYEHCQKESGLSGRKLMDYVNRFYGVG